MVAISPERIWTNNKKKEINGALLATTFEKESGRFGIVDAGNVNLLVGKKKFIVPFKSLSVKDQEYINKITDSARKAGKLIEKKRDK